VDDTIRRDTNTQIVEIIKRSLMAMAICDDHPLTMVRYETVAAVIVGIAAGSIFVNLPGLCKGMTKVTLMTNHAVRIAVRANHPPPLLSLHGCRTRHRCLTIGDVHGPMYSQVLDHTVTVIVMSITGRMVMHVIITIIITHFIIFNIFNNTSTRTTMGIIVIDDIIIAIVINIDIIINIITINTAIKVSHGCRR